MKGFKNISFKIPQYKGSDVHTPPTMNAEHYSWSMRVLVVAILLATLALFIWKKICDKKQPVYEIQHSLRKSGKDAPLLLPDYSQPGKISYQSIS